MIISLYIHVNQNNTLHNNSPQLALLFFLFVPFPSFLLLPLISSSGAWSLSSQSSYSEQIEMGGSNNSSIWATGFVVVVASSLVCTSRVLAQDRQTREARKRNVLMSQRLKITDSKGNNTRINCAKNCITYNIVAILRVFHFKAQYKH